MTQKHGQKTLSAKYLSEHDLVEAERISEWSEYELSGGAKMGERGEVLHINQRQTSIFANSNRVI